MTARGSVIRRGDKWSVVLDLGLGPDRKRRREWHSGFVSEKTAERARTSLLKALDDGTHVAPSKDSVGDFLERWLPAMRVTVRPSTAALYQTLVRAYVIPAIGSLKLSELSPVHLNTLYGELLEGGSKHRDGRGMSAKSVRNIHGVIHRALADALRWGDVPRNVADLADPPKVPHKEAPVWSAKQLRAFLDLTEADRLGALWRLAAMTGMRRGELCGLRWQDVDLDGASVTVSQVAVMVGSELRYAEPKTKTSRRAIAIDPGTVGSLRLHCERQLKERSAFGLACKDTGLVFTREDGSGLKPATVTRMFNKIVEHEGLDLLTVHGLRHSHITALLRAGQPVRVVSGRAGHSSPAITLGVYAHVLPGDDAAAAAAAARAIGEV